MKPGILAISVLLIFAASALTQTPKSSEQPATIIIPLAERTDVSVPAALRQQFPSSVAFRFFTTLTNHDQLLGYDTVPFSPDSADTDNHSHLAIARRDRVESDLDLLDIASPGPVAFHGLAVSTPTDGRAIVAVALTLGVDQSANLFVFLRQDSGQYKVVATLQASKGQVRFKRDFSHQFELWTANDDASAEPDQQCICCLHHYEHTLYQWRDGRLVAGPAVKDTRTYQPSNFSDTPFLMEIMPATDRPHPTQ